MEDINFDTVKIHCSSLGVLFIEPKDKGAKDRGELSETAKKHLIRVYCEHYWGRKKDLTNKYVEKGKAVEPQSIELISVLDDKYYEKNEEERENEWVIGTPDVVDDDIHDVKSSFEAETFLPMIIEPLEKMYDYQMQGYLWLWDKQVAKVRRCLISTPDSIINGEKRKLLYKMDVATEENPEYKAVAKRVGNKNTSFDELSKLIIDAIEQEQFFNKEVLIPKVKAIIRGFKINLATINYNKIQTPAETGRTLRAMEKNEIERAFWQRAVKKYLPDKIEILYDECDENSRQHGFDIPLRIKPTTND
jgi:hypothetical protein